MLSCPPTNLNNIFYIISNGSFCSDIPETYRPNYQYVIMGHDKVCVWYDDVKKFIPNLYLDNGETFFIEHTG